MEFSCDEKVLREMNEDIKKPYANSLLSLATGKHILNGSPLAFGEGNVEGRIKNVMNYKKPGFWVVGITIIIVMGIGFGLMTNPIIAKETSDFSEIYEISEKWAEALKNRDGKVRYELMAPEFKPDYYNSLIEINGDIEYPWVIGWSSPYVESYDIKLSGRSAVITYITKYQSEPEEEYIYQEELFFANIDGKTFVSKYYKFDITTTDDVLIIDIGDSVKFSEKEISEAIELVKNDFVFSASILTKIWYNEEESDKFSKLYLESGKGSVNGVKPENVIVLLSNFDVGDSNGGSLNPNSTYENWQWVLIRDNKTSDWEIDDMGY